MIPDGWIVLGVQLGIVIPLVVALALAIVAAVFLRLRGRQKRRSTDPYDDRAFAYGMLGWIPFVIAVIILLVVAFMAFPWRAAYVQVYEVDTTVLSVSNVLDDASGDLTRTPVVELEGVDRPVVVDDPRIVRLEGRDVTLVCTIGWHYQAADTYSCSIRQIGG